jgi:UDP-N-acetylmuramate dehydrogenase
MSLNVLQNHKLAGYTSWLIGGEADFFCMPSSYDELKEALQFAGERGIPRTVLGGGSNILISDDGIAGLTICLSKLSGIKSEVIGDRLHADCLAGTPKSELLKLFLKHQLPPALFLAGLPGDVGGGVVMNAGVAEMFEPREFMELVDSIEVMTDEGTVHELKKSDLKVSYRHTDGWQPHVVASAKLSWPVQKDETVLTKVREANKVRLSKQPLDKPSCGSVFKNPEGHKVAQLIDSCGLKGFQIGDAQVSLKHANFIVNLGTAKAKDVWSVIQFVKTTVKEKTGVDIHTEVIRLGRWET